MLHARLNPPPEAERSGLLSLQMLFGAAEIAQCTKQQQAAQKS
jgi:hypothetical protein